MSGPVTFASRADESGTDQERSAEAGEQSLAGFVGDFSDAVGDATDD